MREIIIIAAMAENGVIGKGGALPWSVKEDLARFKEKTASWPCVMGRRTWESLPRRPLPGRPNIIVSKTLVGAQGARVFPTLAGAIESCALYEKIFICGGAALYKDALSVANRIELTVIRGLYEGDVFFPQIEPSVWREAAREEFEKFYHLSFTRGKL